MSDVVDCAYKCNDFSWCVGYSTTNEGYCALMSPLSQSSCPEGWNYERGENIATSPNHLVPSKDSWIHKYQSYTCRVKSGML